MKQSEGFLSSALSILGSALRLTQNISERLTAGAQVTESAPPFQENQRKGRLAAGLLFLNMSGPSEVFWAVVWSVQPF